MAKAIISTSGGSGTGSDECTATKAQVLENYTAVTSDSDDEAAGGTMPDKSGKTVAWAGYETVIVQQHPSSDTQAVITISNQYGEAGYYDSSSKVTGNIYQLIPSNIRDGVNIGRGPNHNPDSSNSITGTFTSDGTITAADVVSGKRGYSKGNAVYGNMVDRGIYDVTDVARDDSNAKVNVYLENGAYRQHSSTHNNRHQVRIPYATMQTVLEIEANKLWPDNTICGVTSNKSTMDGQTITPGTSNQTVSCNGKAMTGNITVVGDGDLVAANIRRGKNIFNVSGSCVPAQKLAFQVTSSTSRENFTQANGAVQSKYYIQANFSSAFRVNGYVLMAENLGDSRSDVVSVNGDMSNGVWLNGIQYQNNAGGTAVGTTTFKLPVSYGGEVYAVYVAGEANS